MAPSFRTLADAERDSMRLAFQRFNPVNVLDVAFDRRLHYRGLKATHPAGTIKIHFCKNSKQPYKMIPAVKATNELQVDEIYVG